MSVHGREVFRTFPPWERWRAGTKTMASFREGLEVGAIQFEVKGCKIKKVLPQKCFNKNVITYNTFVLRIDLQDSDFD